MKARVDGNDGDLGPAVVVREAIEALKKGPRSGSDHARVDGRVRNVDDKDVDRRLRRPNLRDGETMRTDQLPLSKSTPSSPARTMYSVGATNSTTAELSSARWYRSAGQFFSWSQSKSCGTSFERLHMQHFQRCPPSMKVT